MSHLKAALRELRTDVDDLLAMVQQQQRELNTLRARVNSNELEPAR